MGVGYLIRKRRQMDTDGSLIWKGEERKGTTHAREAIVGG